MKLSIYLPTPKKYFFTGNQLKLIAIIAMLIDHMASIIIWSLYLDACIVDGIHMMGDCIPEKAKQLYHIYVFMRSVGRITFPIFAFMLVEGFLHTSNLKKYTIRLFLLAMLSEIPYDLANSGKIVAFRGQNVIWTLVTGLITLYYIKNTEKYKMGKRITLTILTIFLGEIMVLLIQGDCKLGGILLISALYIFRNRPKHLIIAVIIALSMISIGFMWIQLYGLIALLFIRYYDGTVGKGNRYLFYIFYPLHLLILGLINLYLLA